MVYDIAVIGYGHEVTSGWNGHLEGRWFVSPQELRDNPFKTITVNLNSITKTNVNIGRGGACSSRYQNIVFV